MVVARAVGVGMVKAVEAGAVEMLIHQKIPFSYFEINNLAKNLKHFLG